MFASITEFRVPPRLIPYTSESQAGIEAFLEGREKDLLVELLGRPLYDELVTYWNSLPYEFDAETVYAVDEEVFFGNHVYKCLVITAAGESPTTDPAKWELQTDTKWLKLLYGDPYEYSGITYNFPGLAESLLEGLYAEYLDKYEAYTVSGNGVTQPYNENSTVVSPDQLICAHWDKYWIACSGDVIGYISQRNSLYGYLISVEADFVAFAQALGYQSFQSYLDYNYGDPGSKNVFGL